MAYAPRGVAGIRRLPFRVGTKPTHCGKISGALCATSAPSDAGRRPSGLGMPRAARGCARASYLQPWRHRRPPSRTTTSSDKLCAEGDTRRDAVATPRLSCCCRHDANTIGALTPYLCMRLLLLKHRSSTPFELWSGHKVVPLKLGERQRPTSCTQLVCTPRIERASGCHGYGSRGWTGHGRPSAVLATGSPWRAA
jgi:hypothetical protein